MLRKKPYNENASSTNTCNSNEEQNLDMII